MLAGKAISPKVFFRPLLRWLFWLLIRMHFKQITKLCQSANSRVAIVIAVRHQNTHQNLEYGLEKKWAYYNQDAIDAEAAKVS